MEGLPGVWAVGDVAAWADPLHGDRHRHEHWTSAGVQAATVAHDILGERRRRLTVPYFWSDQFGLKIQLLGRPEHADTLLPLHGDGLEGGAVKGTVVGMLADDRLVAVAGFGAARFVARYRALLQAGADRAAALEQAAKLDAGEQACPAHSPRGRGLSAASAEHLAHQREGDENAQRDEPVLDLGVGEALLDAGAALVDEALGACALAEHVEALGERVPRLLDLALDGVRVARHGAS